MFPRRTGNQNWSTTAHGKTGLSKTERRSRFSEEEEEEEEEDVKNVPSLAKHGKNWDDNYSLDPGQKTRLYAQRILPARASLSKKNSFIFL